MKNGIILRGCKPFYLAFDYSPLNKIPYIKYLRICLWVLSIALLSIHWSVFLSEFHYPHQTNTLKEIEDGLAIVYYVLTLGCAYLLFQRSNSVLLPIVLSLAFFAFFVPISMILFLILDNRILVESPGSTKHFKT